MKILSDILTGLSKFVKSIFSPLIKNPTNRTSVLLLLLVAGIVYIHHNRPPSISGDLCEKIMTDEVNFHALIIGIDDYQDSNIDDLYTAKNDAKALESMLFERYGFHTEILLDGAAEAGRILNAVNKLSNSSGPRDSVLIYFAGHGEHDVENHQSWWLPVEAKKGDTSTYIDTRELQKKIREMEARHVLLISDAAFADQISCGSSHHAKAAGEYNSIELYKKKSRWTMSSGFPSTREDPKTNGHSLFGHPLITALEENNSRYLATLELFMAIEPHITLPKNDTGSIQAPLCCPMRHTYDRGGEFIFALCPNTTDTASAPVVEKTQLSVTSNASNAEVYLDGNYIGRTNVRGVIAPPGDHTVVIEHEDYLPYQREILIEEGRKKSLVALLKKSAPAKGSLTVKTNTVQPTINFLNSTFKFSQGMSLFPGNYHLDINAEGFKPVRKWVSVIANEDKVVDLTLQEEKVSDTSPQLKIRRNSLGMEFVYIPPDTFNMGSAENEAFRDNDEVQHVVTLTKGFYMARTEVTVKQWRKFVLATGYRTNPQDENDTAQRVDRSGGASKHQKQIESAAHFNAHLRNSMANLPDFSVEDAYPVNQVSWEDTQEFIKWLVRTDERQYRLPTEAEWEYACRAGNRTPKFWGSKVGDTCRYANITDQNLIQTWHEKDRPACKDKYPVTAPVRQFYPNDFGLYDMQGNVAEWCQDWYGLYPIHSQVDPQGPAWSLFRVYRGAGWKDRLGKSRSANREKLWPTMRRDDLGFRLVGEF